MADITGNPNPIRFELGGVLTVTKGSDKFIMACVEPGKLQDCYFVDDAKLVIEVLSPSTNQRDREYKRIAYRQLPGLQEYLLVAQESRLAICYRRLPDGWEQASYGAREAVELKSVGLNLPLTRIYEDIPE